MPSFQTYFLIMSWFPSVFVVGLHEIQLISGAIWAHGLIRKIVLFSLSLLACKTRFSPQDSILLKKNVAEKLS